jgi:hypothetical protein
MSVGLFALGLMATVIGVALIGFGIPINEFSVGNTLIISGTVTAVGGLVLIGLAAAVRQLRALNDALVARAGMPAMPAGPRPTRPDMFEAPAPRPHAARAPFPPQARPEPTVRDHWLSEQRAATFSIEALEEQIMERPRAGYGAPRPLPEPQLVEVAEEAPLSPRGLPRAPARPAPASSDLPFEPKAWSAQPHRPSAPGRAPVEPPRVPAGERPAPPPGPNGDSWVTPVTPVTPARPLAGEPFDIGRETAPPPRREERREDAPEAPRHAPPAAGERRPAAILKSGVVDGMAYTLYTDGSIEAELAEGVIRFGSIEELRTHLEKNG